MSATKLLPLLDVKIHFGFIFYLTYCITNGNIQFMTGKELKEWRRKHGLTQVELSKHLDVAWATVARWEIDVRKIPPYLHLALTTIANNLLKKGGEKKHGMRKKKTRKVGN